MKKVLLFIVSVLASLTAPAQEGNTDYFDYVPFATSGKLWHVVRADFDRGNHHEVYKLIDKGTKKDGKNYYQMYMAEDDINYYLDEDDMTEVSYPGLLREEDRKVYYYDTQLQREILMFDYGLKVGDSYETFSQEEQKTVSYQVLSVSPYTTGPKVTRFIQKADSTTTEDRYLRQWTVCRTDDNSRQKTWIEGVGSVEGPMGNLTDERPVSSNWYLAYVRDNDGYIFLPFTFQDTVNKEMHGCGLPTDRENPDYDWHNQLTYELEGDHLHVYGYVFTGCGPNHYAFFTEEATDDPTTRKIRLIIEDVPPLATCVGLHATNFYVSGFDPSMNYIVVDNQDEEHPVINKTPQTAYRPFIEDGKVWKVGAVNSGNPVQLVAYYYFDGDTIVDGKHCKRMMRQQYANADYAETNPIPTVAAPDYVGAWYEDGQRVYAYDATSQQFRTMYDFSASANDTLQDNHQFYAIGPKQTGGLKGFKGVYREVGDPTTSKFIWLEGVGSLYGPTTNIIDQQLSDPAWCLMACTVGDEVIYLNDDFTDGATPETSNAAKQRLDFTHIIKSKPKAPLTRVADQSLYGEYNDRALDINLTPIDEAYLVRIIDENGKSVYEKAINAGSIVGLNIDISAYENGHYAVMVENSRESFSAQFDILTTAIREVTIRQPVAVDGIYNLQGQRIRSLQKGLNIVNGQKVYVK